MTTKFTAKEPIKYSHLVAPEGRRGAIHRILDSRYVPLHPQIYFSDFAYERGFLDEVIMEIPSSIEQDIAELEKVLGCPIGLRVEEGLIFEKLGLSESAVDLSYFIFSVDNGLVVAECGYQSTSISKNDGGIYNIKKAPGINVTPEYKKLMEQYSFDKGQKKVILWDGHNIGAVPAFMLVLRNFSILFNNLGLKYL